MASNEEIIRIFEPGDVVPPFQMLASVANTHIEWLNLLNLNSRPFPHRKTKIMATIGPSCFDVDTIVELIEAGMRIARINLHFNTLESHVELIGNIREAARIVSQKMGYDVPIAIAADAKGPTIFTGNIEGDPDGTIDLETGQTLKLTTDKAFADHCTSQQIFVDYENIQKVIKIGSRIFLDKGTIRLVVTHIQGNVLTTIVEIARPLGSQKLVNLPNTTIDLPAIVEKEKELYLFAVENKVDIILMSFVRSAAAVHEMRELLGPAGEDISIFAKLQNRQGIDNVMEILEAADGIVLISSILNIEIQDAKLMQMQKFVFMQANLHRKPAVVCSQFMVDMKFNRLPKSCQVNDICYVINDGAHCIMLNSVVASGAYPVEAVKLTSEICRHGESAFWQRKHLDEFMLQHEKTDDFYATAIAANRLAYLVNAKVIVAITTTGKTAFTIAQFLPRCIIMAVTTSEIVARKCMIYRGIVPLIYKEPKKRNWRKDIKARIDYGLNLAIIKDLMQTGDPYIVVAPTKKDKRNNVQLHYATIVPEKIFL